jgi:hypothetical protein
MSDAPTPREVFQVFIGIPLFAWAWGKFLVYFMERSKR